MELIHRPGAAKPGGRMSASASGALPLPAEGSVGRREEVAAQLQIARACVDEQQWLAAAATLLRAIPLAPNEPAPRELLRRVLPFLAAEHPKVAQRAHRLLGHRREQLRRVSLGHTVPVHAPRPTA